MSSRGREESERRRKKTSLKIMSQISRGLRIVFYLGQIRPAGNWRTLIFSLILHFRIQKNQLKIINEKGASFDQEQKSLADKLRLREVQVRSKFELLVREVARGDLYIVNTDDKLTQTIRNTFEDHGCQVSVSQLEDNLTALYILLNKKISIKKTQKADGEGKTIWA